MAWRHDGLPRPGRLRLACLLALSCLEVASGELDSKLRAQQQQRAAEEERHPASLQLAPDKNFREDFESIFWSRPKKAQEKGEEKRDGNGAASSSKAGAKSGTLALNKITLRNYERIYHPETYKKDFRDVLGMMGKSLGDLVHEARSNARDRREAAAKETKEKEVEAKVHLAKRQKELEEKRALRRQERERDLQEIEKLQREQEEKTKKDREELDRSEEQQLSEEEKELSRMDKLMKREADFWAAQATPLRKKKKAASLLAIEDTTDVFKGGEDGVAPRSSQQLGGQALNYIFMGDEKKRKRSGEASNADEHVGAGQQADAVHFQRLTQMQGDLSAEDNVHKWVMKKAAWKYLQKRYAFAELGADCPANSVAVTEFRDCRIAGKVLPYQDITTWGHRWANRPAGCFYHDVTHHINWNSNRSGTLNPEDKRLCVEDADVEEGIRKAVNSSVAFAKRMLDEDFSLSSWNEGEIVEMTSDVPMAITVPAPTNPPKARATPVLAPPQTLAAKLPQLQEVSSVLMAPILPEPELKPSEKAAMDAVRRFHSSPRPVPEPDKQQGKQKKGPWRPWPKRQPVAAKREVEAMVHQDPEMDKLLDKAEDEKEVWLGHYTVGEAGSECPSGYKPVMSPEECEIATGGHGGKDVMYLGTMSWNTRTGGCIMHKYTGHVSFNLRKGNLNKGDRRVCGRVGQHAPQASSLLETSAELQVQVQERLEESQRLERQQAGAEAEARHEAAVRSSVRAQIIQREEARERLLEYYALAEAGGQCKEGYVQVVNKQDCRLAAQVFEAKDNVNLGRAWTDRPSGCFHHKPSNHFNFNKDHGKLNIQDEIVCVVDVTSTRMAYDPTSDKVLVVGKEPLAS